MKINSIVIVAIILGVLENVSSFQPVPVASTIIARKQLLTVVNAASGGYVPDGLTPEAYEKIKQAEAKKYAGKNLGALGARGFKSRSLRSFQEAMERGEASHLMPVFDFKKKVSRGKVRLEDVPYMQRGGSWDNSDVRGAKKKRWLPSDKAYANGGYKKEQSASILGSGDGLDWTGKGKRSENHRSFPGFF